MKAFPLPQAILICAAILLYSCNSESLPNKLTAKEKKEGWVLLFNGYSTEGWMPVNGKESTWQGWQVRDGLLVNQPPASGNSKDGGDIITLKTYGDFELSWEWKLITKGGNSGIKYYVARELSGDAKHGIGLEYQILDDANHEWMLEGKMKPGDYHTVGALYELYAPVNQHSQPLGEWNISRIAASGNRVEHWLNGYKTVEFTRGSVDFRERVRNSKFAVYPGFGEAPEGHILLQDHGSEVHFRNIKIRNH